MAYLACLCGSPDVSDVEMSGNQSQNVIGQTVRVVLSVSSCGTFQFEHLKGDVEVNNKTLSLVIKRETSVVAVVAVVVVVSLLFL